MNIRVLQGLNLKNPTTTVIAEMTAVKPELLDFFKQLHPVFMVDYSITGEKTLEVQTHLPNVWKNKELLHTLEQHGTGSLSYQEAEDKTLDIVRSFVSSMSTVPILSSAHTLGYETLQFFINKGISETLRFNRSYTLGIGREQEIFYSASSTKDSHQAVKVQKDKSFTNQAIENMGLPIARWTLVDAREDLAEAAEKTGYPLVLKPVGLTGGHGVQIGMQNLQELEDAWDRTHEYYEKEMKYPDSKSQQQMKIIIQRMLKGQDYRLLIVNGRFEVGTHRLQAQVTGDGEHTVAQLIEEENKNPARDVRLPTHTLKPIVIDKDLVKVLTKQGLSVEYIPAKDETVRVRDVASMSQGGITADVTETVHPQIRLMCESIAKTLHAYVLGIDVLCQDITKPLTLDNGGIIEMNTMPEMYLNIYPVIGNSYPDVPTRFVQGLTEGKPRTRTVVVLGDVDSKSIHTQVRTDISLAEYIGYMSNNTIYINEQAIQSDIDIEDCVLDLKKNALLDTIVLHYPTVEEVEQNGFGFNTIDLLIATEEALSPIKPAVDGYISNGRIAKLVVL